MNSDWNFGDTIIARTSISAIVLLIMTIAISACSPGASKSAPDNTHKSPIVSIPSGNIRLEPQTNDTIITGFLLTHTAKEDSLHHPTPNTSIRFFPAANTQQHATFAPAYEVMKPGYYSVYMHDNDVAVELTTTRNVGLQRYFFPPKDSVRVIIDKDILFVNDTVATAGTPDAYYVIHFSQAPKRILSNTEPAETTLCFDATDEDMLYIKAGISLESTADAEKKIGEELPGWDFEQTAANAGKAWK